MNGSFRPGRTWPPGAIVAGLRICPAVQALAECGTHLSTGRDTVSSRTMSDSGTDTSRPAAARMYDSYRDWAVRAAMRLRSRHLGAVASLAVATALAPAAPAAAAPGDPRISVLSSRPDQV